MGSSPAGQQVLFLLLVLLGFALLVVRPARARARLLREVRSSLAVGREVMTTAGLYARITDLQDDVVVLEISPGVTARFDAAAVVRVLDGPAPTAPDRS